MQNLTAVYVRLSRDDDKSFESESIVNQKAFLLEYAKENNMTVVGVFIDDGWSGTTFERPSFKKMIELAEQKKINTIITKDLSRLGRDYIQTGYYIEQYFPMHNIRYIAVNDGIDTFSQGNGNDMSPFKAVFNDMYAKDISKKVRTALNTKKKSGCFIGSKAPYGYKKDENNKNHLVIDEDRAYYVRQIYKSFLSGKSLSEIAQEFTLKNISTPSGYKGYVWNGATIKNILQSPTYMGNLTQNTSKKINYKIKKKIKLPKSEWIIVENTHEGIVSKEEFEAVQQLLVRRSYKKSKRSGEEHLLSGLVYCADCGKKMSFMRESNNRVYIVCSTWRKSGKSACSSHCIRESIVEDIVKQKLKEIIKNVDVVRINESVKKQTDEKSENKKKDDINTKILRCKKILLDLYKDKSDGVISEKAFKEMTETVKNERELYEKQLAEIKILSKNTEANKIPDIDKITRSALILLVDKIYIRKDKEIEIFFRFKKQHKDKN